MIDPMDSANPLARLRQMIAEVERLLAEVRSSARTLASATIARGNLLIKLGGSVLIRDGGNLDILDGGRARVIGPDSAATLENGRMGMVSLLPDGTQTYPSFVARVDGFLADAGPTLGYSVFRVDPATGAAVVSSTTNIVQLSYTNTSAAANTRILLSGQIQMVTSSRRYKKLIRDAVVDTADVLRLRPRTWTDRQGDDPNRYVGFIAEELDEIPTLRQFVERDEEGRPNAISYDRLTVALLVLAQAQQTQIDGLTGRLDALDGGPK